MHEHTEQESLVMWAMLDTSWDCQHDSVNKKALTVKSIMVLEVWDAKMSKDTLLTHSVGTRVYLSVSGRANRG